MPPQPFKVKAVFDYASPHEDDLSFPNGQIITVTEEEDDEWYFGEYKDPDGLTRSGLFPRNHVERFEPVTPPRPARHARKATEPPEPSAPRSATEIATGAPVSSGDSKPVEGQPAKEEEEEEEEEGRGGEKEGQAEEDDHGLGEEEDDAPAQERGKPASGPQSPVHDPSPKEPRQAEKSSEKTPSPVASMRATNVREPAPPAPLPPREEPAARKAPPPVAEKPSGGSFKDRIAAFNKPTAAPIAPIKPGGLGAASTGFIKKPFVPPPPSRNAYVPPPREKPQLSYHREEEPERPIPNVDPGTSRSAEPEESEQTEDRPKPTSLKERIALLQKQQLEQAQRHAEAAQKKEKPKRPLPKKTVDSNQDGESEAEAAEAIPSTEPVRDPDTEEEGSSSAALPPRRRTKSKDELPSSEGRELFSDTNDADQSADPETEDNDQLSQSAILPPKPNARPEISTAKAVANEEKDVSAENSEGDGGEEEEEEDEMDPEIRRRMELRERMAKMSGGMGMAGMFGPPGGLPAMPKKPRAEGESKKRTESTETASPAAVSVMALPGMSMPGMQKVKSPPVSEEPEDIDDENVHEASAESKSTERPYAEPPAPPRRSTDGAKSRKSMDDESLKSPTSATRPVPPPPPQGRAVPPVPPESRPPPPIPPREASSIQAVEDSGSDEEASSPSLRKREGEEKLAARPPPPLPPTRPEEATSSKGAPPVPIVPPPVPSGSSRAPPLPPMSPPKHHEEASPEASDSEEEVTEYEGDYDTDIAVSAAHKDALTAHDKRDSTDDTLTGDEAAYHHGGLPSIGIPGSRPPPPPAPPQVPRGVPPPPPSQPPRPVPSEMPRAAPPPPPPIPRSATFDEPGDATTPTQEPADEDLYSLSPPKRQGSQLAGVASPSPPPPPAALAPPPPPPKQSLDVPRDSVSGRRSAEVPRHSIEQGFIADDVDLDQASQWWVQRRMPPPSLQNRSDVAYEIEESTAIQDKQELVSKQVHVLWMDYSKTIITARFSSADPSRAELQQRHEPPPQSLRQDQLEHAYARYGPQIAEMAKSKTNSVVGNGTPYGLVSEIFGSLDALPPVGNRGYGALVYANLANATVQQHDEIRAGDIISFRNAKLQGHRGGLKQKYNIEVGKPDHVGIVVDWDGTKKKVQAWEQGRESKKVKVESFKLGDLRSGEVKVWRVMPRTWVGWGR